jgi:hypothetical protein
MVALHIPTIPFIRSTTYQVDNVIFAPHLPREGGIETSRRVRAKDGFAKGSHKL